MIILSVALTSFTLAQSFADENILSQEQKRQNAVEEQLSTMSGNTYYGDKDLIEGYDRVVSKVDPGLGHENHQLAILLPISDKEYSGTVTYSASEHVQLVSLKGPLTPGDEKGKMSWTPDGATFYELILVNDSSVFGKWSFVGNGLALHTYSKTPFVVDYKLEYFESKAIPLLTNNSVNDINIMTEFTFSYGTIPIDSFNVFKQISGFGKTDVHLITLQGVVGLEKSILYKAADTQFNLGSGGYSKDHQFSNFGLAIHLKQGEIPIRTIAYRGCDITNYSIDTLYDNDYSYNQKSVFVLVDNFEMTCNGMVPYHYDYQKYIDQYGLDHVLKMTDMDMTPKKFNDR